MDAKWFRNSFIWLIVMVFVLAIAFQVFHNSGSSSTAIPATGGSNSLVARVLYDMQNQQPATITQDSNSITLQEGSHKYTTSISDRLDITQFLSNVGIPTKTDAFNRYITVH